jgi:hypothetical protein
VALSSLAFSLQMPRQIGTRDDLFGIESAERKKTAEGWNIYSEKELKLNEAGSGTDLCPFDCDCCF